MKGYDISRFDRKVETNNGRRSVRLTVEARDLGEFLPPTEFQLIGNDNALHTFKLTETIRQDDEVLSWMYSMATRSDIRVEIYND